MHDKRGSVASKRLIKYLVALLPYKERLCKSSGILRVQSRLQVLHNLFDFFVVLLQVVHDTLPILYKRSKPRKQVVELQNMCNRRV